MSLKFGFVDSFRDMWPRIQEMVIVNSRELDEELRLQSLHTFDILDTAPEAGFDRLTSLAARLFHAPIALVSLVDRDRQWFKSSYGFDACQTARDVSFCSHSILMDGVMVVTDATQDTRFADNPFVTGEPGIRFYAGAPLKTSEGYNLGSICILDTVPREFSVEDQQSLADIAAMVMDEMELRASQTRLRNSELRFRALVEGTSDIITVVDESGVIQFESPCITDILGYRPEAMIGCNVFEYVHPDDRPWILSALSVAIETGLASTVMEFRFRHQNGTWRVLEAVGNNRLDDPGINGFVISSRDITERKRRDERLQLLESVVVEANDTVIITEVAPLDEPGPRIIYVNAAFTRLTGYSAAEAIGRSPRFLQGPETARESLDQMRAGLESLQPVTVEVLNYHKNGSTYWAEMSLVPVANAAGHHAYWISIQRDVTERKHAQKVLQIARDEAEVARVVAERANQAKSEFLSRMSHELRTPLNAILGFGQLLKSADLEPDDMESADHILKAGRHLLRLINEVLDIAQIESGRLTLSPESFNASEIMQESLSFVRSGAAAAGLTLQDQSQECQIHVQADKQRLKQILINLLSNAVKYNRPGGAIKLFCKEAPGGRLRICVGDDGIGIAADKMSQLFTPFARLGAESSGIEGMGIGLALSRHLAEVMGGTLGVESIQGKGSTFWVELPRATEQMSSLPDAFDNSFTTEQPTQRNWPEGAHGVAEGFKYKVLYIEDNMLNLQLVERVLRRRDDIEFLSAVNGRDGLRLVRDQLPDLILLDLHLPEMSGEEILDHLQADSLTRSIPVIVVSADITPQKTEELLEKGAKACLSKPFAIREFERLLDEGLHHGTNLENVA